MSSLLTRPPAAGRLPVSQIPLVLTGAGLATLVAAALYLDTTPAMVVIAPVAFVCFWFAVQLPTVSMAVMILAEVTNVSGVLATRVSLPIFQASLLLGTVALLLAVRSPDIRARLNRWTLAAVLLLGCYLVTQLLATLGSADTTTSVATLTRAVIDCYFVMVVLMLIQVTGGVWTAAATFVIPFAVISALTLVNQLFFGGANAFGGFAQVTEAYGEEITTLRYGGPLPDSNFWGRHLVMALPLAGALLTRAWRRGTWRDQTGWTLALVAILAGVYLTQSRGTFLATAVAVVAFTIACGPTARRWGLLALPLVAIAGLLTPGIGDRLTSAADELGGQTISASVDPSILGRLASQEMAGLMFENRPVFGYGPDTFGGFANEYTGLVPTAIDPKEAIEAPHNLYLQTAAETGVVGILGWAVMVLGFLTLLLMRLIAEPRARDRVLAAGVFAAIVAWSAASVTLHLAYFRTFGIVLAMAAALAPQWPANGSTIVGTLVRSTAVWLTALLVGVGVAWGVSAATAQPAVEATQRVTVKPVGTPNGYYLYGLDLRSRKTFFPTLSLVLHPTHDNVTVTSDVVRGTLTFKAVAPSRDEAVSQVQQSVSQAQRLAGERMQQSYELVLIDDQVHANATSTRSMASRVISILAGLVAALVVGLMGRRRSGWRALRGSSPALLAPRGAETARPAPRAPFETLASSLLRTAPQRAQDREVTI